MKRRDQRGFIPSPLITDMYGHFANVSLHHQYHKPSPIDSTWPPPEPSDPGPPCPCNAFKILDLQYQQMSLAERAPWKAALKKQNHSAYTLFMKENLTAAIKFGRLCANPSPSGGYSCLEVGDNLQEEPPPWSNTIGLYTPPLPPENPWTPGICPDEEYTVQKDIVTNSFWCKQICGTVGLLGALTWIHDFPYPYWYPEDLYDGCNDWIISVTPLTCGDFYAGFWAVMLEAFHVDERRDPPEYCSSYAVYTRPAAGPQSYPIGIFYKRPLDSECDMCCPQLDWPDTLIFQEYIH